MKRSLTVLAILAMSSSAFAVDNYNREKVLELFAQYNPSVLQRADENETYNSILQELVDSYNGPENMDTRLELIALIRNFDNSLALSVLDRRYGEIFLMGKMSGTDIDSAREKYRSDVQTLIGKIWAVSVQVQELRLQEYKEQLKTVKKDDSLPASEKKENVDFLNKQIQNTRLEIKNLKKDPGTYIANVTDMYVLQTERNLAEQLLSAHQQLQQETSLQAAQAENLKISYKNKKPVAK